MSEKVYYNTNLYNLKDCNFITPCPYDSGYMVGDYHCLTCKYYLKNIESEGYIHCSYLDGYKTDGKKYDTDKIRLDLVPPEAIEAIGEVLTFGAKKYSANSWQKLPDFRERYYSALLRHLMAWKRGEDLDNESGLSHLKHAICNIAFLVWEESQCQKHE